MRIPNQVKQEVCERAGGVWVDGHCEGALCEICKSRGDFRGLSYSHNPPKGMGGSKRTYTKDKIELLCYKCHNKKRHHLKEG